MTKDGNPPTGDRRVRRTQAALQRALIQLVQEQDLSQISVADVVERAEVGRSTFYDHYRDVHELAEAACTAMIDDLIESLPDLSADSADPTHGPDPTGSLRTFFANLAEHAGLYHSLLGPQGSARVIDHVRRRITTAVHAAACRCATGDSPPGHTTSSIDIPHDVPAAFVAGALIGVAADWLHRGCPRTPAEVATLTWPLLGSLYQLEAGTPPCRQESRPGS
ncbi:TetR/AcrR family transcriptional regulator [Nonomuraea turcica]|uniref:TetR/AcrR family transcriptional regulator n=1 Tax=Nonomuraea sp. G32 TaxID=3067274 RepID=UPI00273AD3A7|nr:TetR/AcrR family transcriptional regulator [Nonomuraea sp. G32]MDP4502460.1 TetR/AcrR family transcriptional regulator [Nonomuraea sp. G32]